MLAGPAPSFASSTEPYHLCYPARLAGPELGERKAAGNLSLPPKFKFPRTVQLAVQQQTDLLNRPALEMAVLAAVAGRRFSFSLLQALTGYGERELLPLLKELIRLPVGREACRNANEKSPGW